MKSLLVLSLLLLAGCNAKPALPTSYYCLTPMGWISFDDVSAKVADYGDQVLIVTEESTMRFTTCASEQKK